MHHPKYVRIGAITIVIAKFQLTPSYTLIIE
jgi:hypothetical protein